MQKNQQMPHAKTRVTFLQLRFDMDWILPRVFELPLTCVNICVRCKAVQCVH